MSARPEDLQHGKQELSWEMWTDGTLTSVELSHDGNVVGEGEARRLKGDRRDGKLGLALATARALEEAAAHFYRQAEKRGYRSNVLTFTEEEATLLKESLQALMKLHKG